MKLFISIVFVFVFALAGKSQQQINDKTNVDINCKGFTNIDKSILPVFYGNVFDEQDSNDVDKFLAYCISTIATVKPLSLKVKFKLHLFLPFYQIHLNKLLIDLPPPVHSLMF